MTWPPTTHQDVQDKIDANVTAIAGKADSASLAPVATSGAYTDLTGAPTLATVATTGSYTDLTNKPTIPAAYTDEQAQDAVGAAIAAGTQTGISVTYDDANNALNFAATGTTSPDATTTSKGIVQLAGDLAGTAAAPTVPGLASKADTSSLATVATTGSYTDLTNQPTIPPPAPVDSVNSKTGAVVLSAADVGALTQATADTLYVAQANAIDLEGVEDDVARMFTGGTQSGISFVYDDANGIINTTVTPGSVADATTTSKGAIELAGDLGGTAAAPTVTGGTNHGHTASQISDASTVGKSVLTAADAATARTAIGAGTSDFSGSYIDLTSKPTIPTVGAAGAGAGVALSSTDATVTNARTPTAHASTHAAGGSDAITVATSQISATGTASSSTYLRGDGTWSTPAGGSGSSGTQFRGVLPTGAFVESLPRYSGNATGLALTNGQPRLSAITLRAGEVVTNMTFVNGGVALAGGSHQWAALTDINGNVLAISPDDTGAANWSISTPKTFTMSSPYTIPTTGVYYAALCVVASTLPTPMAISGNSNLLWFLTPYVAATAATNTGAPPTVGASLGTLVQSTSTGYVALG